MQRGIDVLEELESLIRGPDTAGRRAELQVLSGKFYQVRVMSYESWSDKPLTLIPCEVWSDKPQGHSINCITLCPPRLKPCAPPA